jgi:hypothetical protein
VSFITYTKIISTPVDKNNYFLIIKNGRAAKKKTMFFPLQFVEELLVKTLIQNSFVFWVITQFSLLKHRRFGTAFLSQDQG